jgi:hypothetical protein
VSDLEVTLATVRERISKYQRPGIGEQDTKAALIVPVLRTLGWDVEDLDEVKLEYRRRSNDNPVDYALFVSRTARLFVEAKALGVNLADPKWANQMLTYAVSAGVEWVVLTDGNEYRIYNAHAAVPIEQKLFRLVRVNDDGTRPAETLALLSKAQMADHMIDELWKAHFIDRQIQEVLEGLFGQESDASLVRLIRTRVPVLTQSEVRAGLSRLRVTFDFPRIPATPQPIQTPPSDAASRSAPDGTPASRQVPADDRARGARGRPAGGETLYLLTPVRDEAEATVQETLDSLLGHGVYVFADRTAGRDRIKEGDWICFYSSGVGIVADAEIASRAEKRVVKFAKDSTHYPWAFAVRDVRFYFDSPVVIDAPLRARLQAFTDHGHDPAGAWSWLVQGTRYLTAHDFAVLTRR